MFINNLTDKMSPEMYKGGTHTDSRGKLFFNNDFDVSEIKRIYVIENENCSIVRAWQGHKIEQRWFSAIKGSFKIQLIAIDNWSLPSKKIEKLNFVLHSDQLDVLHIPAGYVSSIQSIEEGAKLLVMANYFLGEIEDDYRFAVDYFE
ncbi:MAG TPA: WxcM-like domain-containing protein [Flavobacterium sp.]